MSDTTSPAAVDGELPAPQPEFQRANEVNTEATPRLTIERSFETLLQPLSDDERRDLEADILVHGVRDPLVVWRGRGILLDGHHRYSIAMSHGLDFKVVEREFTDHAEAAGFIVMNQLSRRNLTPEQMSALRGEIYETRKGVFGHRRAVGATVAPTGSVAAELAEEYGMSPRTIKRDGAFARDLKIVQTIVPDIKQQLSRPKKERPTRQAINKAAELAPRDPEKARKALDVKKPARVTNTMKGPDGGATDAMAVALERNVATLQRTLTIIEELELGSLRGHRQDLVKRLDGVITGVRNVISRLQDH